MQTLGFPIKTQLTLRAAAGRQSHAGVFAQAMGEIHAILPDGQVVKNIDVFKRLYEAVGLGWVYRCALDWLMSSLTPCGTCLFEQVEAGPGSKRDCPLTKYQPVQICRDRAIATSSRCYIRCLVRPCPLLVLRYHVLTGKAQDHGRQLAVGCSLQRPGRRARYRLPITGRPDLATVLEQRSNKTCRSSS